MKKNNKRNKQVTDSHIPAISLCLSGNGETVYQDLGDHNIEVAEILKMPFHLEEQHVDEFRYFALNFVWWFELLKQNLLRLSSSPENFELRFLSKDELIYSITLNCNSITEATDIISSVPKLVSDSLGDKLKSAQDLYSTPRLYETEEDEE